MMCCSQQRMNIEVMDESARVLLCKEGMQEFSASRPLRQSALQT